MDKENLYGEIIDLEWDMFDHTQNIGGRASCQENKKGFIANRMCQFLAWNEETLASYLEDLKKAKAEDRNLMVEKYARMMAPVYTSEYNELAAYLPKITEEKADLVRQIVDMQMGWMKETSECYPVFTSFGRPKETDQDEEYDTSYQSYLRGEISTYSENTLRSYLKYITELKAEGKNIYEMILQNTAHAYGFEDAQAAEDNLRKYVEEHQG